MTCVVLKKNGRTVPCNGVCTEDAENCGVSTKWIDFCDKQLYESICVEFQWETIKKETVKLGYNLQISKTGIR